MSLRLPDFQLEHLELQHRGLSNCEVSALEMGMVDTF